MIAIFSRRELADELRGAHRLVVLVVAHERLLDAEVPEQIQAVPRVLAGDEVGILQHFERAERDVAKIADGRGDEGEHGEG